jgi:hypothetical protein
MSVGAQKQSFDVDDYLGSEPCIGELSTLGVGGSLNQSVHLRLESRAEQSFGS